MYARALVGIAPRRAYSIRQFAQLPRLTLKELKPPGEETTCSTLTVHVTGTGGLLTSCSMLNRMADHKYNIAKCVDLVNHFSIQSKQVLAFLNPFPINGCSAREISAVDDICVG